MELDKKEKSNKLIKYKKITKQLQKTGVVLTQENTDQNTDINYINDESLIDIEEKFVNNKIDQKNLDTQSKKDKLLQASRDSRKRKNIYYKNLEQQVLVLQQENERLKKNKIVLSLPEQLDEEYSLLVKKIDEALLKQVKDPSEVQLLNDSIQYRKQEYGTDRNDKIKQCFKDIIKLAITPQTAAHTELYKQGNEVKISEPLLKLTGGNKEKENLFKQQLTKMYKQYDEIFLQLFNVQEKLLKFHEQIYETKKNGAKTVKEEVLAQYYSESFKSYEQIDKNEMYYLNQWEQLNDKTSKNLYQLSQKNISIQEQQNAQNKAIGQQQENRKLSHQQEIQYQDQDYNFYETQKSDISQQQSTQNYLLRFDTLQNSNNDQNSSNAERNQNTNLYSIFQQNINEEILENLYNAQ